MIWSLWWQKLSKIVAHVKPGRRCSAAGLRFKVQHGVFRGAQFLQQHVALAVRRPLVDQLSVRLRQGPVDRLGPGEAAPVVGSLRSVR